MVARREVLKALIAGMNGLMAAVLAVPVIGYLCTPLLRKTGAAEWISLGPISDVDGKSPRRIEFRYMRQTGYEAAEVRAFAYLVRLQDKERSIVLSPVCTHMGCYVRWDDQRHKFMCPCHGGVYLPDGTNVAGPPPRRLAQLPTRIKDGALEIRPGEAV